MVPAELLRAKVQKAPCDRPSVQHRHGTRVQQRSATSHRSGSVPAGWSVNALCRTLHNRTLVTSAPELCPLSPALARRERSRPAASLLPSLSAARDPESPSPTVLNSTAKTRENFVRPNLSCQHRHPCHAPAASLGGCQSPSADISSAEFVCYLHCATERPSAPL